MKLLGQSINPLARHPIDTPLDVGVRSINSLLTVGRGQRIGLFAGSGVGKSVLLGMMARYTSADVIVVGLIGERGREVKEFVERILGPEGRRRSVVVASPADNPPLIRLHGAWLATSIAEYFRERGLSVLLIMDSLTRFAQAQREIGLAIGEAPATKGYPPSVFARLPALVERAGNGATGKGSITAFYTVLTEGDDQQDPIADAARAILDGHVVLSRRIAEAGQYPAIDVEASVSRVMQEIVPPEHAELARRFRQTLVDLPAASRPHLHRRLPEGQRSAHRRGHRAVAGDAEIPHAAHRAARRPRDAVNALRQLFAGAPAAPPKAARMKRSERLDVVQQATARTEREHAERVAAAQRHVVEMEEKLAALEKYRSEYEAGFAARSRAGFDAAGVRDFQTFLARLGEALTQQAELVSKARGRARGRDAPVARSRAARPRGRYAGRTLAGRGNARGKPPRPE